MTGFESVAAELPGLVAKMTAVGFAVGVFVPLVITGLCSAFHTFVNLTGGR